MDLELVRKIVALVEEADISELEVEEEGLRVSVRKHIETAPPTFAYAAPAAAAAPLPTVEETGAPETTELDEDVEVITSPMVGTFYRAPAPDADPFVEVGATISPDTVVCILEAMKVMNELKAGIRGRVVAILVENGQPVEYGQPLFHIRKNG